MGRKKICPECDIPIDVVRLVRFLCAGYDRRVRSIKYGTYSAGVLKEYRRQNAAIDAALSSVEPEIRQLILADIAEGRGYNRSGVVYMCESAYTKRKRRVVHDIASNLKLIE